MRRGVEKS
jgi:aldehyde:ferredoxin oxidoreductase